jgi:hypothetical protein
MAARRDSIDDRGMTIIVSLDGLDPSIDHLVCRDDQPPACGACGLEMHRSELRVVRRQVARVGAPSPPPQVLRTWTCGGCGQRAPRLAA